MDKNWNYDIILAHMICETSNALIRRGLEMAFNAYDSPRTLIHAVDATINNDKYVPTSTDEHEVRYVLDKLKYPGLVYQKVDDGCEVRECWYCSPGRLQEVCYGEEE